MGLARPTKARSERARLRPGAHIHGASLGGHGTAGPRGLDRERHLVRRLDAALLYGDARDAVEGTVAEASPAPHR